MRVINMVVKGMVTGLVNREVNEEVNMLINKLSCGWWGLVKGVVRMDVLTCWRCWLCAPDLAFSLISLRWR